LARKESERAQSRREIETGIAELARKESEHAQAASRPAPPSTIVKPESPGTVEPSRQTDLPDRPSPPFSALNAPKERSVATYIVPALVVVAAAGYWYLDYRTDAGRPKSGVERMAAPQTALAADSLPAHSATADLGERPGNARPAGSPADPSEAGGKTEPDPAAGHGISTARAVQEAPSAVQPAVAKVSEDVARGPEVSSGGPTHGFGKAELELTVEPTVEIAIDGHTVGRSPISVPVPPGKHVLQFTDASRGINVSRSIRVGEKGKTSEHLVIGKGTVEVSAPDGAAIYIDGKSVGRAPLKEISVFEGKHRILATLGQAKWQQGFSVSPNERMSFKIETTEQ
jgi:serine/threonine-protein kinase